MSKHQLEHLANAAASPAAQGRLSVRFAGWREVGDVLPPRTTFSHIVCVDPVTVALTPRTLLSAFFAQQRLRLDASGTLTVLSIYLSPGAEALQGATAFVAGQALPGIEPPTKAEVESAAAAAGLRVQARLAVETGLGAHTAATARQWRLRLVARWRQARLSGASDTALRRCAVARAMSRRCIA